MAETQKCQIILFGQSEACSGDDSHEMVTQALLTLSWPCLTSSHIPFSCQVPQTRLPAWLLLRTSCFAIPAKWCGSLWEASPVPVE